MSKTIANRFDAPCHKCGQIVPAGAGVAIGTPTGERKRTNRGWTWVYQWRTEHSPKTWHGSPVSGKWVGGCYPELNNNPNN